MATPTESLLSIAGSVSTKSTKKRVRIFRDEIPAVLSGSGTEAVLPLIDIIFKTLYIYDDRGSRKAVDDIITKGLQEVSFMKSFAAALVQVMEKQARLQSHVGCDRLLQWSCLLLSKSKFATVSKNAMCRVATVQALLLNLVMQRSFHERRAYKKTFCHLFSQSPDIYKMYIEELKDARIPYKDSSELIWLLLEYSSTSSKSSSLYEQCKPTFLDIYLKAILNAREKPARGLSEAFHPLFKHMLHEDFQNIVLPSAVKMLKCNPEIVLESVGILLKSVNLDLSKYAIEILSVVLPQAQHADKGRRVVALAVIRCLSQKSSNPDALEAMFNAVKSVIGGSEGRLTLPYQSIGMINTLQEMCNAPDGNEEVKLAILSALGSWAARSADAVQSNLVLFFSSGIKEKEALRRGHLRCLRTICKNMDAVFRISSLLEPLIQLVKTGFTKASQRLDGIYALLLVGKITAIEIKAEEIVVKDKIWSLISQNEPSLVPISMASKLSTKDCMACVDLLEVMLVEHLQMLSLIHIAIYDSLVSYLENLL